MQTVAISKSFKCAVFCRIQILKPQYLHFLKPRYFYFSEKLWVTPLNLSGFVIAPFMKVSIKRVLYVCNVNKHVGINVCMYVLCEPILSLKTVFDAYWCRLELIKFSRRSYHWFCKKRSHTFPKITYLILFGISDKVP